MTDLNMPGPESARAARRHPCADPANAGRLIAAVEKDPAALAALKGRHVLSVKQFSAGLLRQLFRLAAEYETGAVKDQPMRGRILSNVFLDQSREHTRLSFNSAWLRMGGALLNFERSMDEITRKRNAPDECGEVCGSYSDVSVLRTLEAESFADMVQYFQVPVINAGNGQDEHPTHALADLYTLFKWRPELMSDEVPAASKLQIAIGGDPSRTRTIRSFLYALGLFPAAVDRVVILERLDRALTEEQTRYLTDCGVKVETVAELYPTETNMGAIRRVLPDTDLLYLHYLHTVHAARMDLVEGIEIMKPDALVLNPQIQNEEFSRMMNDSPHNGYFAQSRGSVFVRMALFDAMLRD